MNHQSSDDVIQQGSKRSAGRRILAFLAAVAVAYLWGTISYSQLNLASLVELGIPVSGDVRLATAWHDVTHMYDLYLPLILVGLLIAFSVAGLVVRWVPQLRSLGFVLAGFAAIFALDYLLGAFLTGGTHPLVVTRTLPGLIVQCLSGALAGWVFVSLFPPQSRSRA